MPVLIEKLDHPDQEIMVVADASEIKRRDACPEIWALRTGENRGFASGNNAGAGYDLSRSAGQVWLLNNDAAVDRGPRHVGPKTEWARRGL